METFLHDVRFGLRLIRRAPRPAAAAIVSLALGIGACGSIFGLIDALGFRPLAVRQEHRLVRVSTSAPGQPSGDSSYRDYVDLSDRTQTFSGLMAHGLRGVAISGGNGGSEIGFVEVATGNYFTLLGVRPPLGRMFGPEDDRPGAAPVTVISRRLWQRRFAGDPAVVGKSVRLTGVECTVVGVAPAEFTGTIPLVAPDVWVPTSVWPQMAKAPEMTDRGNRWFEVVGRLNDGVRLEQAQAEMEMLYRQLAAAHPATNRDRRAIVLPETSARRQQAGPVAPLLLAAVAVVLFIACVNVAGLLMARGESRRAEMAMRIALGAGRGRLLRQLFTEAALLSSLGALGGLVLVAWTARLLPTLLPASPIPLELPTRLDGRVIAFTVLTSLFALPVFSLAPVLMASKPGLVLLLRAACGPMSRTSRAKVRHLFLVAQIAVSFVLLSSAGLLVRSLVNSQRVDLGFERCPMLIATMIPGVAGYDEATARSFYQRLLERVSSLSGVQRATLTRRVPLSPYGAFLKEEVALPDAAPAGEESRRVGYTVVEPGYFATMGTRIVGGRGFTRADGPGAPRVALVNQTMARRFWGGRNPIGQRFRIPARASDYEVVGVVEDGKYVRVNEDPAPMMYFAFGQMFAGEMTLVVRTSGAAQEMAHRLGQVLQEVDPAVPTLRIVTLDEHLQLATRTTRTAGMVAAVLGALGLLLAVVGLYGVIAFAVSRRAREFGVRLALGARPVDLRRHVLRHGLVLVATGLGFGLCLAFAASRLLRGMLLGVGPMDPLTLAGSSAVIAAVTMLATCLPARDAARVDPVWALRQE
jgi:predicted permease